MTTSQMPYFRQLDVSDLDSAVHVENAAFTNPAHRCTPEKFEYRLTRSPPVCYGLFSAEIPDNVDDKVILGQPPQSSSSSGGANGPASLVAHACSTLGPGPIVTDTDMDYPKNFREEGVCETSTVGHQPSGRTVCLHSFAVLPEAQGRGVGKSAMKAYLQVMAQSGLADRVALLCQDYLVSFYEQLGFVNIGKSEAEYGGGGWYNMIFDLPKH